MPKRAYTGPLGKIKDWFQDKIKWELVDTKGLTELFSYFDEIEEALTTPTEQEVCEAINDFLGGRTTYFSLTFYNKNIKKDVCYLNYKDDIEINEDLPPHLITMIGKFYEGEMNNE